MKIEPDTWASAHRHCTFGGRNLWGLPIACYRGMRRQQTPRYRVIGPSRVIYTGTDDASADARPDPIRTSATPHLARRSAVDPRLALRELRRGHVLMLGAQHHGVCNCVERDVVHDGRGQ